MCFYVQKKESRKTSVGSQNQLGRPGAAKSHIARDRFYPILVRDSLNLKKLAKRKRLNLIFFFCL